MWARSAFGRDNPRAAPFVGWQRHVLRVRQLLLARKNMAAARGADGSVGDFPATLQIQTISGCNASCLICPQRKIRNLFPQAVMSDALFDRITEQCAGQEGLFGVGFVLQNEPLTDPTLFQKIRRFRDRVKTKTMAFIVTNGTLLTRDRIGELLDSGLDAMHISCNGFAKEDYEAVNQGKSWEEFEANLEHLLSQDLSRIALMLSFVRHSLSRKETARAMARWRARGVPTFVHGINNRGGMVEDYEKFAIPIAKESLSRRLEKVTVKGLLGCCPYPFIQMSVLATGEVLLCTHDWARKVVVGDLNREPMQQVWNGERMRQVRKELLAGRAAQVAACSGCDVFEQATFA